jgi:hypothetical protein
MSTPQEDKTTLLSEGVFFVRTLLQQPDELPTVSPVTGGDVASVLPTFPPVADGLVFALTMGRDGKIALLQSFSVPPGMGVEASAEGHVVHPVEVLQQARLEALRISLKGSAAQGAIRAAALIDLVCLPPAEGSQPTNAVRVQIEHEAAEPVICYVPYELKDKQWEQGETWEEQGEPLLFGIDSVGEKSGLERFAGVPTVNRPSSAQESDDRVADEWCGFSLSVPNPWARAPFCRYTVPGTLRCAWSARDDSSIVVFLQEPGGAADPRVMLVGNIASYDGLAVKVHAQEVRTVAGMRAMWLVVQGKGTGGTIDGEGPLETVQHWVAIPREQDVVVLLLTCPADDYDEFQKSFGAALQSLKLTGSQTKRQKASK